jgi:hypothetical protein
MGRAMISEQLLTSSVTNGSLRKVFGLWIPANEVLHNLEGVIQHIVAEANAPPPSRCA